MDCSLPGSSVHGIFPARVLMWVAISFSNKGVRRVKKAKDEARQKKKKKSFQERFRLNLIPWDTSEHRPQLVFLPRERRVHFLIHALDRHWRLFDPGGGESLTSQKSQCDSFRQPRAILQRNMPTEAVTSQALQPLGGWVHQPSPSSSHLFSASSKLGLV